VAWLGLVRDARVKGRSAEREFARAELQLHLPYHVRKEIGLVARKASSTRLQPTTSGSTRSSSDFWARPEPSEHAKSRVLATTARVNDPGEKS
jgi:hypothetical protein